MNQLKFKKIVTKSEKISNITHWTRLKLSKKIVLRYFGSFLLVWKIWWVLLSLFCFQIPCSKFWKVLLDLIKKNAHFLVSNTSTSVFQIFMVLEYQILSDFSDASWKLHNSIENTSKRLWQWCPPDKISKKFSRSIYNFWYNIHKIYGKVIDHCHFKIHFKYPPRLADKVFLSIQKQLWRGKLNK
jgi:hypothetical protein